MRLGASSYIAVNKEERKLNIFNDVPSEAANVWIERTREGKYVVSYNYDFFSILESLNNGSEGLTIETIPWITDIGNNNSIHLVYSGHGKDLMLYKSASVQHQGIEPPTGPIKWLYLKTFISIKTIAL